MYGVNFGMISSTWRLMSSLVASKGFSKMGHWPWDERGLCRCLEALRLSLMRDVIWPSRVSEICVASLVAAWRFPRDGGGGGDAWASRDGGGLDA